MTWSQFITPPQSVDSVFSGDPPALRELHMIEARFRPAAAGEEVSLLLEWPSLPPTVPPKWKAKGYKALQLVLSAHATTSIEKVGVFVGKPVNLELAASTVLIREEGGDATLRLTAASLSAQFHPYSGDGLHEGIHSPPFRGDA